LIHKMKSICPAVGLIALMIFNLTSPVFSTTLDRDKDFGELENVILAELHQKNAPGAAIAIVSRNKIVFAKGFGVASVETNTLITPDTLFQIGSITKTFTATVLLTLAEEGKLKTDVPVGNYVKGLTPKIANLTLHHLLSHTAGIIDEPDEYGGQDESMMASYLHSWKANYILFDAGEVFSYSNSGFALAGLVAQEVTGTPYADLMVERMFQPLGMTRTTFRPTVAMTYPLAVGHQAKTAETPSVVRPLPNDARLYPAGTMYSSVNEMARFALAFLNEGNIDGKRVLSPAVIAKMQTQNLKQLSAADDTSYGYGLFMNHHRGVRQLWHEGSMTGYVGSMLLVPEHHFAVIILCNANGVLLDKTQEKAMELMLPLAKNEELGPKTPLPMSESEMKKYVGIYEQPNRFRIEVLVKEGGLFIKEFNNEMTLTKIGENKFSFKFPQADKPLEIFIKLGKDGKPLFIHQYVWAFKRRG
jgi:CubicO group peptidase (beta-lactamase class C family)